jgi:hypothetical protein
MVVSGGDEKPADTRVRHGDYTTYTYWTRSQLKDGRNGQWYSKKYVKKSVRDLNAARLKKERREKLEALSKQMKKNIEAFSTENLDRMIAAFETDAQKTIQRMGLVC